LTGNAEEGALFLPARQEPARFLPNFWFAELLVFAELPLASLAFAVYQGCKSSRRTLKAAPASS
jgi:hypothetical protein